MIGGSSLFSVPYLNKPLKRFCSVLGEADKKGRLERQAIHLKQIPIAKVTTY